MVMPPLPDSVVFCGTVIPIDDFDMRERLDRELVINTYYHSSTIQILKRANRYFPEIEKILREEKMPDDLKYIAVIESGLAQVTSPSGAKGFWQFMPAAAEQYGLVINQDVDERFHVAKSTHAACAFFRNSQRKFNDWILSSAAYNCGPKGLQDQIDFQKTDDFFDLYLNRETSRYVFRILALKIIMSDPEAYGYPIDKLEMYKEPDTKAVEVTETIADLSAWVRENGSNLRALKRLNTWLLTNRLPVSGNSYTIKLPRE